MFQAALTLCASGIEFKDRGVRQFKGIPGAWQLFAADAANGPE
jgi:hypothetical protein